MEAAGSYRPAGGLRVVGNFREEVFPAGHMDPGVGIASLILDSGWGRTHRLSCVPLSRKYRARV